MATAMIIVACAAVVLGLQGVSRFADMERAEPTPIVTTEVVIGTVVRDLELRGDIIPLQSLELGAPKNLAGAAAVVTEVGARAGINSGTLLMKVADRPIFILAGSFPMYRDLSMGMSGSDVAQLRKSLADIGYPSDDKPNHFGLSTAIALYSFYEAHGVAPSDAGGAPLANRWQVEQLVVPTGELVFFDMFPARLSTVCPTVGQLFDPGGCRLESDVVGISVTLPNADASSVSVGMDAEVIFPDGSRVAGHVGPEVESDAVASLGADEANAQQTTVMSIVFAGPPPEGMAGSAMVVIRIASSGPDVLVVPAVALRTSDQANYWVEVAGERDQRERVPVTVGLCARGICEVSAAVDLLGSEVRISGGHE